MLQARAWLELLDLSGFYLETLMDSSRILIDVDYHFLVVWFGRFSNSRQASSSLRLGHFDWPVASPGWELVQHKGSEYRLVDIWYRTIAKSALKYRRGVRPILSTAVPDPHYWASPAFPEAAQGSFPALHAELLSCCLVSSFHALLFRLHRDPLRSAMQRLG